jgi:chromatin structure-remodeling complex subunit RSC1/2
LVRGELQKLVTEGYLSAEVVEFPDLGPIPEVEESPPPGPDDEEEAEAEPEDEDDEDEEDEEDEDTDDDRPRRGKGKKARRPSALGKREGKTNETSKEDPEAQKKRGRPPKVHTPMEARINNLLKGMRKFKNGSELKILPFEKLPDKTAMPEYYQEIKNPIAMDLIKRKAKRKKYQSVDQALKDLELMFENAKSYNLEDSQVYKDAVDLQAQARLLAEQEKKKPDSDFVDEDGRLPLLEIIHNGEVWKAHCCTDLPYLAGSQWSKVDQCLLVLSSRVDRPSL